MVDRSPKGARASGEAPALVKRLEATSLKPADHGLTSLAFWFGNRSSLVGVEGVAVVSEASESVWRGGVAGAADLRHISRK